MKKLLLSIAGFALGLNLVHAQMGGGTGGPKFDSVMIKLFGDHTGFTARMEMHAMVDGQEKVMPAKISLLDGKSRWDVDMEDMVGSGLPPQALTQMKSMGMGNMSAITRPDKQVAYMVYPDLKAYFPNKIEDPSATNAAADFKIKTTELGKEDVDGHPCVKVEAIVTDDKGNEHKATLWKATDLKDFPVKIEMTEAGQTFTLMYENVKLTKPDASLFEPPADYKEYDSMNDLMQQVVMPRMQGMQGGTPPPAPPAQ